MKTNGIVNGHADKDTDETAKDYTRFVAVFMAVNMLCGIVIIYALTSTRTPSYDEQDEEGE
jgi:hypothetical protein